MWKWSAQTYSPLEGHSLVSFSFFFFFIFGRLLFPVDYSLLANQGLLVSKPQPPPLFSRMYQGIFLGI